MNKVLLFFALSFVQLSMAQNPCIVYIPDDNFKNALLNYNYPVIDINGDGEIQCSEAEACTGLINVSNNNIADLTGIEAFINILALDCTDNQLTSLDVSTNSALAELYCRNNQLTNLYTSTNSALVTLDCADNQFTSLNISTNSALSDLYCNNNQLTNLDISTNSELYILDCSNNQLTRLNLANGNNTVFYYLNAIDNPNLTCIQVDDSAYSNTSWTSSNFAKPAGASYSEYCTPCIVNIPDANFKDALLNDYSINTNGDGEIQCYEAAATRTIRVDSYGISDLTGVEDFVNLTTLNCSDNPLMSLDVSSNTALKELFCYHNQLTSLDVSANTALIYLYCTDNQLTSLDISANTALSSLMCDNNQLTSLDISANTSLSWLDCVNNQLTSLDISHNPELFALNCSDNQLTSLDATVPNSVFGQLQCTNNQLTSLDLSNCNALRFLSCDTNQLTSLNIANGNNTNLYRLFATDNPNLTCIQVDDATYSASNWGDSWYYAKPPGSVWSENCGLGLSDVDKINQVSVYPNPTKGITQLNEISDVQIFDTSGRLILEQHNTTTIDLSNQESGVYLLNAKTQNGIGTARIIKE